MSFEHCLVYAKRYLVHVEYNESSQNMRISHISGTHML